MCGLVSRLGDISATALASRYLPPVTLNNYRYERPREDSENDEVIKKLAHNTTKSVQVAFAYIANLPRLERWAH
jgi:hypothetical protein